MARKIKFFCNTGFAGEVHEDEIEVEDNATNDEIQAYLNDWVNGFIDSWWTEVEG